MLNLEQIIQEAAARGEFDNLPGAGKPGDRRADGEGERRERFQ